MMKPTYCNPLCVENIPAGRWLDTSLSKQDPKDFPDYRSISDPSVIYHDGKWILFASYGIAHVSEDFVHWKHVDVGVPNVRYSPAVVCFRGKWYLQGHGQSEVYCADNVLGPYTLCGNLTKVTGETFRAADGCFLADGDRLYFYWCKSRPALPEENADIITGTVGVELDPEKPWQAITEPVWINHFNSSVKWQRTGERNQHERRGWVEGQWMFKIGSRYYLLHSGSGTEFSSYANGIAYSDEGPLSGFVAQKRNDGLLTEKRTGLMRGAGHGSVAQGPNGTYWVFYTNTFRFNHMFERRISMDPIGIDKNGELFCTATTETPQFAPGVLEHPENGNDAGLLPLTFFQEPATSSHIPGREPIYAVDESTITWWQPSPDDKEPTAVISLGGLFDVSAIRLIWRDIGMETMEGIMPGPFQYVIEYSCHGEWAMLVDASKNDKDLAIDYRTFETVQTSAIRLRILGSPEGIQPGLVNITAFGTISK